jgi:hypothetical protein
MKRALFAALLIVACTSSAAPPLKGELFVLQSIDGIPLPAPYAEDRLVPFRVLADTIALLTSTSGERRARVEIDNIGTTRFSREAFDYVRNGDRMEISFRCPPDADCIRPPHLAGTVTTEAYLVDMSVISRSPLLYRHMGLAE